METARFFCNTCGQENAASSGSCIRCGSSLAIVPAAVPGQIISAAGPLYAGFWIRFLAHIIDHIVVNILYTPLIVVVVLLIVIPARAHREPNPGVIILVAFMAAVVGIAISWLYEAYLTSSSWQATLGKRALQLKVTDLNGGRLSFGRSTGRYFAKILSGMILGIGFIMAGFTERKQALHDMIAGTLVERR